MFMIILGIVAFMAIAGVYYLNTSGIEATPVINSETIYADVDKIADIGTNNTSNSTNILSNQTVIQDYANPFMESPNSVLKMLGDIFYKIEIGFIDYIRGIGLNVEHMLFVGMCILGGLFGIYFLITFASNKVSSFAKIFIFGAIALLIIFIVYNGSVI